MAEKKLIEALDISRGWLFVENVNNTHGVFFIAIKEAATEASALPIDDLKYVVLELGIPSGIENKPITLQTIKLNFDDITSFDDKVLNSKTACVRVGAIPSTIYIRPIAYGDGYKEVKEGLIPVSINVLAF